MFSELKGLSADEKERLSAELKEGRLSDEMKDRLVAEFKKGLAAQRPPMPDLPASTGEVMMLDSYRSRQEMEMPDKSKMVMIFDWRQGKCLSLSPTEKQATVLNITNMPEDNKPKSSNPLAEFRSLLLDTRDQPESKRESLGEKDMDGRHVVGFRISGRGMVLDLWGDPKTGLPVRLVGTMAMMPNVKVTMSDFIFNVDMDESLFSVEPPAGYEIIKAPTVDASPPEEKDLIETFRRYSELGGGPFPESLDMGPIFQILAKKLQPQSGFEKGQKPPKPSAKQIQEMMENQVKLQRGVMFAVMLSPEADAHYAGKGIKLGAADTPIFWYCSKESKKYRIIYADLSVREADAPPSAPDAQPVPGAAGPKK